MLTFFSLSANACPAKNGEQLTEEKEAGAFDQVEKGEPLNPKPVVAVNKKATPDKKPEVDNHDEKKSNGANTPV